MNFVARQQEPAWPKSRKFQARQKDSLQDLFEPQCDVKNVLGKVMVDGSFLTITAEQALTLPRSVRFYCQECLERVSVHRSYYTKRKRLMPAHFEHHKANCYCSMGMSGKKRKRPHVL